jgi:hypothetical protein
MKADKSMQRARHQIITLMIAAALTVSLVAIAAPMAAQAQVASVSAGTGQRAIVYHAHRIASPDWAPCFATTCDAETGPGTTMYFVVYDSTGRIVAHGFADETGTQITGLTVGATYYLYPADCNLCHNSTHNVVFDHWGDGSTDRPKAFTVQANPISADAYYRIVEQGTSSAASTTTTTPSSNTSTNTLPPPPPTSSSSSSGSSTTSTSNTASSSLLSILQNNNVAQLLPPLVNVQLKNVKMLEFVSNNAEILLVINGNSQFEAPVNIHQIILDKEKHNTAAVIYNVPKLKIHPLPHSHLHPDNGEHEVEDNG